jgi:hypothetical protein
MLSCNALRALLASFLLQGCVQHVAALQNGQLATIAGKETSGLSPRDAAGKVLIRAAELTIDHGYRYFTIIPADIRPGSNTVVKVQRQRTARAGEHVWDAYEILRSPDQKNAVSMVLAPGR